MLERDDEIGRFMAEYMKKSIEEETYNLFSKLSGGSGSAATEPKNFSHQHLLDLIKQAEDIPPAIEIHESAYCYKTEIRTRGRADARRPNAKKPLYKRVVTHKPIMYKFENKIIAHPSLAAQLRIRLIKVSSDQDPSDVILRTWSRFR